MGKRKGILIVDVGTTKVCALIGEERENKIWITGMGIAPSKGLKTGNIINIEEATYSIEEAIKKAQSQANVNITEVYTSIAGTHISTINGMGVVVLKEKQVTPLDVEKVLNAAQTVDIPPDKEILHVIPQEFIVDQQKGILHPVGMSGLRLEAYVSLIVVNKSALQNLVKCFENLGLEVNGVIFQGLASAEAVLTPEEKELGVILLDFGGGTTDIVVYWDNVLRYVSSIPVGGELLTSDLAIGLKTSKKEAEKLKIQQGVCLRELVQKDEMVEVPGIGNRPPKKINKKILAEILELRVKELFADLIKPQLNKIGLKTKAISGIVFTGGSSLIPGLVYLADQIFDLPTRIGYPPKLEGLTEEICYPQYATSVGMLMYIYNTRYAFRESSTDFGFLKKLKNLFKKIF